MMGLSNMPVQMETTLTAVQRFSIGSFLPSKNLNPKRDLYFLNNSIRILTQKYLVVPLLPRIPFKFFL